MLKNKKNKKLNKKKRNKFLINLSSLQMFKKNYVNK